MALTTFETASLGFTHSLFLLTGGSPVASWNGHILLLQPNGTAGALQDDVIYIVIVSLSG